LKRVFFIGFLFILNIGAVVFAQTGIEKVKKVKESTLKEIEYANKLLEETKGKTKQSLIEIDVINEKLKKRQQYIVNLATETSLVEGSIEEYEAEIGKLEAQVDNLKSIYASMVVQSYKKRWNNYFIFYLLAAENANQFYQRFRFFKTYTGYIRTQKEKVEAIKLEYAEKKRTLEQKKLEKVGLLKATKKEFAVIQDEGNKKKKLLNELKNKQEEIERQITDKEKLARRLDSEMEKILAAERKKVTKGSSVKNSLTPVDLVISNDFEKNRGRLPWPTPHGVVTGRYGEHQHPDFKSVKVRNDGIYISTVQGETVRAIFKGVVSKVFSIPGQNYTVIIRHGTYFTLYHNLIQVNVKAGQSVEMKEAIGKVFTDSESKETTLYFQVWKDMERSDPEIWLAVQ
jgi:septal ring factor EnvC (AmiA/AmiB activator)